MSFTLTDSWAYFHKLWKYVTFFSFQNNSVKFEPPSRVQRARGAEIKRLWRSGKVRQYWEKTDLDVFREAHTRVQTEKSRKS